MSSIPDRSENDHSAPRPGARRTIVHVVEWLSPGGIETLVLDMVAGLPGRHVVVSLKGRSAQLIADWPRLADCGAEIEGLDRRPGISPGLVYRLVRRLRAIRPDTVVVHHAGPLIYGGLAARICRVPTIVHVEHDAWHYDDMRRRVVAGMFFRLVRPRRVAISREIATKVVGYFPATEITVIPPGIDMALFRLRDRAVARQRLGLAADTPVIGTAGRLVPVKSQITLIDAVAELGRTMAKPPVLVIVGDGPERARLADRIKALGVEGSVRMVGHRDDLPELLPAFDVFALPSLNEGLPRGVLEAQAAGLPVVASHVGALSDAVCPETGQLVPPADAHALAQALARTLAAPGDPKVTRQFVESRFGLATTIDAFAEIMRPMKGAIC